MRSASPRRTRGPAGLTLLELSVVVVVLLVLLAVLFIGASAWRRGTDRAACVLNLRNVQQSVRCYQNLYGYSPGSLPYASGGTQSITEHLFEKGYIAENLYEMLKGERACPGGGFYSTPLEDRFPADGSLYARCSFSETLKHELPGEAAW